MQTLIVVSNKAPLGKKGFFKRFIWYEDDCERNMPVCIMLSKKSACKRDYDETKYISS